MDVSTDGRLRAWWDPGWYNLDQSLTVGRRDTFAFFSPHLSVRSGHDLVFANAVSGDWTYLSATVQAIEHERFGWLDAVDTLRFGEYTFRFHDGRWVTIEAEQDPGHVNSASPEFPQDICDPAWAHNSGWALAVTLDIVSSASRPA